MTENNEEVFDFPCEFPIKVIGKADCELDVIVYGLVHPHAPDLGEGAIRSRASRQGRYRSITVTVLAKNRAQLDDIYRALSASEHVLMVL